MMYFLHCRQAKAEARYFIALAQTLLCDVMLVIGAPNNGGKTLRKDCESLGFVTEGYSKHKNSVVVCELGPDTEAKSSLQEEWIGYGELSYCDKTGFYAQPVFMAGIKLIRAPSF